ncbi:MAG: hypothetical protein ABFS45_27465 [Pseudomonadota bacterium]
MGKAGKSILWFLGACLVFSESIIAGVAKLYTNVDGVWVLLFGFICLGIVLATLLLMFRINPAFITAERGDLVPLTLIQQVARDSNPDLLKQLVISLSPEAWTTGEPNVEEAESEEPIEPIPEEETDESEDDIVADEEFTKVFAALKSVQSDR